MPSFWARLMRKPIGNDFDGSDRLLRIPHLQDTMNEWFYITMVEFHLMEKVAFDLVQDNPLIGLKQLSIKSGSGHFSRFTLEFNAAYLRRLYQ